MNRTDIINFYISKYKFEKYLEIGVADGVNIERVTAKYKHGVDPGQEKYYSKFSELVTHKTTSDNFFAEIKDKNIFYDFIFIDGLHHSDQVDKDIYNSLNHLSPEGIIMLHDANPSSFEAQLVPRIQIEWNGDVWKSIVKLRCNNPNVEVFTVDTDYGCAILRKGSQKLYNKVPLAAALNWNYFVPNRKELLNLISVEEFIKKLP